MGSLACARAQVTVEVIPEQQNFLQGEALVVNVRIVNRSGQTLQLGAGDDWLTFSMQGQQGTVVARTGDVPVAGEFTLESSKAAIKSVDLAPWFLLTQPGHYTITATVKIKEWHFEAASRSAGFDIAEGAKLWEQLVGLPRAGGATNSMPEVRKYVLQQTTYMKGQPRLYLRVIDSYGKSLRVVPVGQILSFSRPDPRVDQISNLHLLFQSGPNSFTYAVFNPEGEVLIRQIHEYTSTRPHLRIDEDNKISVAGGARRVTPNDIPAPPPEDSAEALVTTPTTGTTNTSQ